MNFFNKISILIRNLKYLSSHDLTNKEIENDFIYHTIRHIEDLKIENMVFNDDNRIKVLNDDDTWNKILSDPKSIVRIGDGELSIINGKSIDFQKYDKRLADYLIKILSGVRTDLYIGIDYCYFDGFDNVTDYIRRHNYLWGPEFKKTLVKYCNPNRVYISASFNQLYIDYEIYDWDKYIDNIKNLFRNKDIVVFAGKGIFDKFKYNVFDNAKSSEYVWSLSNNAFDEFDQLLIKAKTFSKDKTLCFILGPTSKPLVYELSKDGFIAWDLGHMAKDYDCCLRKTKKEAKEIIKFFAPD